MIRASPDPDGWSAHRGLASSVYLPSESQIADVLFRLPKVVLLVEKLCLFQIQIARDGCGFVFRSCSANAAAHV